MKSWEFISSALSEPFRIPLVSFRVGNESKSDKNMRMALAYADPREYQNRLDEVVGMGNWNVEYRALGEPITSSYTVREEVRTKTSGAIIARLSIIHPETGQTLVREEVGESDNIGNSFYPTASAQAFKRACAAFGLGRYLYNLPERYYPTRWDSYANKFVFQDIELVRKELLMDSSHSPETIRRMEERVIRLMYQTMKHEKFEMPPISITEMNYQDLIDYGVKLKELAQSM
jgi:hypothetical protein